MERDNFETSFSPMPAKNLCVKLSRFADRGFAEIIAENLNIIVAENIG